MSIYTNFGDYATNREFLKAMSGAIPVVANSVLSEAVPPRPIDPADSFANDTLIWIRFQKRATLANQAIVTADRYAPNWALSVISTGTIPIKGNKPDTTDPGFDPALFDALLGLWDSYAGVTPDQII